MIKPALQAMITRSANPPRSLVLRGVLGWLSALMLVAILGLVYAGPSFASGEGHSHEEEEPVVEETGPATSHDNSDGHHDVPIEEIVEDPVVDHHGTEMPAGDHHDEASSTDDHHGSDAMAAMEGEHDHSAHEDSTWANSGFERLLAWFGKFHPAATNFPIALLLVAAFAEVLFLATGKASFRHTVRFCLWTGVIGATGTAVLGWFFVGFDYSADDLLLASHRWNGTAVGIVSLLALWLGERTFAGKSSAVLFRVVIVIVALMASYNGLLGGKMVYGEDHYDWPTSTEM